MKPRASYSRILLSHKKITILTCYNMDTPQNIKEPCAKFLNCMFPLIKMFRKHKFTNIWNRLVELEKEWRLTANRNEGSFWGGGNIIKLDGGVGLTMANLLHVI